MLGEPPSALVVPSATSRARRRILALLVAMVAMAATMATTASPASAHAVLVASSPADGERLPEAPTQASLTFSEGVSVELGGVRVLNGDGQRVDVGTVTQPNDEQLLVGLEPDLPQGTYLISYRVVSSDGHPVSGAVVFAVGDVLDEASVSGLGEADQPLADALGTVGRALAYAGTLLAAGLASFVVFVHDGGPDRRRLVGLARGGVLVGALGATLGVVAQASLVTGLGLGQVLDGDVLRSVLRQGDLGWSIVVLLGGLALLYVAVGMRRGALAQGLGFYGAVVACGSFALYGHTTEAEARLATSIADVIHVVVAAVWFGGLVGLAVVITGRRHAARPPTAVATDEPTVPATAAVVGADASRAASTASRPGTSTTSASATAVDEPPSVSGDALDTAGVVLRFSTAAALSVFALWLSGAALTWSFADGLAGLRDDRWGPVLLAKVGVVAVVLALAAWNRYRLIPTMLADEAHRTATDDAAPPDLPDPIDGHDEAARWRRLLTSVRVEALLLAVVIVLTAVLVSSPPPSQTGAGGGPYSALLDVQDGLQLDVTIAPASVGRNTLHLTYLDADTGRPVDAVREVTVELVLPSAGVGPIEEVPTKAGAGHYILVTEDLRIAGTWDVTFRSRLDQFTEVPTTVQVPIA